MKVRLSIDEFVNDKLLISYGADDSKQALFMIVDEEYEGSTCVGRINKINILTRDIDADGNPTNAQLQSCIIGMGNGTVGVIPDDASLLGKTLNKDNMDKVTVWLYEDGDE